MTLTRRQSLATAVAFVAGITTAPACESPRTVRLRLTWTGGTRKQIDYQTVPADPPPKLGRIGFGQGVFCMVEEA